VSKLFGYHGRYLRIDVSKQSCQTLQIPREVLWQCVGGTGLATWILTQETPGQIDALHPDAPLIFVFSPLVGSPLTTSAKFGVVAKSPLTNRLNDSLASSHFAIAGKKTGVDAIVVTGHSAQPTLLRIEPDSVAFEPATDLWGLTIPACEQLLRERLPRGFRSAVIGPAGERGVRYASISHDGRHAGRGGLGAVMGSKNLKAICVRGDRITQFAKPDALTTYSKALSRKSLGQATAKYRELGTVDNLVTFNRLGTLPTRNFQSGTFDGAHNLAPEVLVPEGKRTRSSCAACTIGCEHIFETAEGRPVRMEYENLFALGPLCGVSDPEFVLKASAFCDDHGMDTISAGVTVAFAMECSQRGLIPQQLRFGNGDDVLSTLQSISARTDVGDLLALGTRAAAEQIGQGSQAFAAHVKGLELPGYEPRALQMMGLGFAVNTRGADHNRSGAYQVDFSEQSDRFDAKANDVQLAIDTENEATIMDSLILCKFLRGVFEDRMAAMAEMLHLTTGTQHSGADLVRIANSIVDQKKRYNIQQGWTPAEDTLPARFMDQALGSGASEGAILTRSKLNKLILAYNRARGWSDEGWLDERSK
jgi:aldehyde:ferredoxin oxidoreductase